MTRQSPIPRWWTLFFAATLTFPAAAQESEGTDDEQEGAIEEIVVTGSRIIRRDFNAPSPITTIDRDDIQSTVQATLEETLNQLPQVRPDMGRTTNNGGLGTSNINLRGLGAQRTLVMLNGRRVAPTGTGSAVDVNNLPQALVERVEIISGGASAVYGSDAVAGVVNFITRDDFDGLSIESSAYITEEGDAASYDLNLAWGNRFARGRGSVILYGNVLDRQESFADSREITAVPVRDDFQGQIVSAGSFIIPAGNIFFPQVDLGEGEVTIRFSPDGVPVPFLDPDDRYNYQPANYLQVPLRRYSGGLFLDYEFDSGLEGYLEFSHTRTEGAVTLAPAFAFDFFQTNLDNPVLTPEARQVFADFFFPSGPNTVFVGLARRLEELGPRIREPTYDYTRLVTGLRGDINDDWDFDVWLTVTRNEEEVVQLNSASFSRFQQGLLVDPATGQCFDPANGCVPVDPFGEGRLSPEALAFIRLAPFVNTGMRDQDLVSAFMRGKLFDGWAGPVSVALGVELRSDSGELQADEALFLGDAMGFNGFSGVIGKETVAEFYAEGLIPLAENAPFARYLALEIGGRLSGYDHAGNTETYKFGGEWEPVSDLRFRAMFQRSVRAPNLFEAFQETRRAVDQGFQESSDDPCSASREPVANGNAERCMIQGIPADQLGVFEATPFFGITTLVGGNPDVEPETAETLTVGLVYGGFQNWTVSVDYFDLDLEDAIGNASPPQVCFDEDNTVFALCDAIRRDPLSLNVIEVDARRTNLGTAETRGFDVQVDYATELPAGIAMDGGQADFSVRLLWTHLRSASFQANPAVQPVECVGTFGFDCHGIVFPGSGTHPENRVTASTNYRSGRLSVNLGWRWIEGTSSNGLLEAQRRGIENPVLAIPSVGSENLFDLGIGFQFSDRISARLNIANLFDSEPPLMGSAVNVNTDDRLYDVFGRSYMLRFTYQQ